MTIYINSFETKGPQNVTILQYLKFNGYDVPRFCFHEKLDIAGNCRICLVEVEGVNKPIASCTVKTSNNLSIYTNSVMVRKARQAVLEYLLLSHPLDCPICDQGGECDLQDQTLLYGPDRGRFFSNKKSVYDFDLGPFVKTTMTRCINCTRCVRFVSMYAPTFNMSASSLGHVGRGNEVYIGQYLSKFLLNSELSGNVIDLCPVGALTSKSYSFTARPWEAIKFESFDIFDTALVSIRVDVRDNHILRILPWVDSTYQFFFNEWITDLTRFSFDGYNNNRLKNIIHVFSKQNLTCFYEISVEDLFYRLPRRLRFISDKGLLRFFLGEFLDLQQLIGIRTFLDFSNFLLKKKSSINLKKYSFDNVYFTEYGLNFKFPCFNFRNNYFNTDFLFSEVDENYLLLTLGVDLRLEMPTYHLILRQKLKNKYNMRVMGFGSKSLATNNIFSNNLKYFIRFVEGKSYICNFFLDQSKTVLIYNNALFRRYDSFSLYYLFNGLNSFFSYIYYHVKSTTILNSFDLGLHFRKNKHNFLPKNQQNIFYNFLYNISNFYLDSYLTSFPIDSISFYYGTHFSSQLLFGEKTKFCKQRVYPDYFFPILGFFEKESWFFSEKGSLKRNYASVSTEFLHHISDWDLMYLPFNYILPTVLLYNLEYSLSRCHRIVPIYYEYSVNSIHFSLQMSIFMGFYLINAPIITIISDLIYNTNIILKHSFLMQLNYECFYREHTSVYF